MCLLEKLLEKANIFHFSTKRKNPVTIAVTGFYLALLMVEICGIEPQTS